MQKQAIFLMGPTAAGKTALAIELTKCLPVDIISVDSAMVYKGMDIGTGKPSAAELLLAPHQLINICDPSLSYSVAQFCDDAQVAMQNSWRKNRIPLLVGGTMMYFKALQFGLAKMPSADIQLRESLVQEAKQLGWPAMHAKLAQLDPLSAQRLNANDTQRIQRALEVNILTGKTLGDSFKQQEPKDLDYKLSSFAIIPDDRALLHTNIKKRFEIMLENGFIEEVRALFERGDLSQELPSIRSVGYRQIWAYLNNETAYTIMCEQAIVATRQLAKRQLTWLRSWPELKVLSANHNVTEIVASL
jgi:tRNA dimethylallyltransferase